MDNIKVDISQILNFVSKEDIQAYQQKIDKAHNSLIGKSGKGNDFLGWIDLPTEIDQQLSDEISEQARWVQQNAEILVVVGIGGSYLGSRAVIEALKHSFDYLLPGDVRQKPIVLYAGQNLSEDYLADLIDVLDHHDYAVNVISKSGTTTEPAVSFRILKNHLETKYGKKEASKRIIATTDESKGALKQLANNEAYKTFVVPDDVGGRYSVLTPVGLLPIAVAGFDISELVKGAVDMRKQVLATSSIDENPAALYAAARNALYNKDLFIEIMVNYQANLYFFTEWWKQLYGESEGKENKGIFPAGVSNTTDLHSMGQYIQEGERKIFETVLSVEKPLRTMTIPEDAENLDKLNFIAGKNLHYVNQMAEKGTTLAHKDGGVPNIRISLPGVNAYYLGQLIYFYEFACGLSGYVLDVNPFDQPGVEAYKRNMFALLGKPGFEKETAAIRKRV
jgi:glucose-6-phosphate isomerase